MIPDDIRNAQPTGARKQGRHRAQEDSDNLTVDHIVGRGSNNLEQVTLVGQEGQKLTLVYPKIESVHTPSRSARDNIHDDPLVDMFGGRDRETEAQSQELPPLIGVTLDTTPEDIYNRSHPERREEEQDDADDVNEDESFNWLKFTVILVGGIMTLVLIGIPLFNWLVSSGVAFL